jgi:hypothetical protein
MTATLKAELTRLHKAASERIDCAKPLRLCELSAGADFARQGDVYLFPLARVPAGCVVVERPTETEWQLAVGATQGSRHVVAPECRSAVWLYRLAMQNEFAGPCLECPEGVTITHPEHGVHVLPPGIYAVGYQRVWSEVARRVAD